MKIRDNIEIEVIVTVRQGQSYSTPLCLAMANRSEGGSMDMKTIAEKLGRLSREALDSACETIVGILTQDDIDAVTEGKE